MKDVMHYPHGAPLPVPTSKIDAWMSDGVDRVRILFDTYVDDLIHAGGMDEWLLQVDRIIGLTLTDVSFGVDYTQDHGRDSNAVTLWVEGAPTGY